VLKEHDAGAKARDLCRKIGISEHTFYRWRSKYGGMEVSDDGRLEQLDEENWRLESGSKTSHWRIRVKAVLESAGGVSSPTSSRRVRGGPVGMNQRRSCALIGINWSCCRHVTRRLPDEELRTTVVTLAKERPRGATAPVRCAAARARREPR
jgi:hypothetical protein